jgi:hypothetical protein
MQQPNKDGPQPDRCMNAARSADSDKKVRNKGL